MSSSSEQVSRISLLCASEYARSCDFVSTDLPSIAISPVWSSDEDGADEPEYASAELDTELELDFEEEVELDFVEDELPADDGALSEAAVEPEPLSLPDPLSSENSAAALASFRLKEKYPLLLALLLTRAFAATICRIFP